MSSFGSSTGQEFKKDNSGFYSGIVVKNNDPLKLNRVKVFIPELSNQPFDDWLEKFDNFIFKAPGVNANPKSQRELSRDGDWSDTAVFEQMANSIPWAEPLYPLIGESGNYRYYNNQEDRIQFSDISDGNYLTTDTSVPSYSPSYWYEREDSRVGDAFKKPLDTLTPTQNPYAFSYNSFNYPNKAKGLFGIPEVGSKVWVFHYEGNLNFPVYFGVRRDYRELALLNDTDNDTKISNQYPNDFENGGGLINPQIIV